MHADSTLLGAIYDAALNPAQWEQVTADVAAACGAERLMLAATDLQQPDANFQHTYNIDIRHVTRWRSSGFDAQEVALHERWTRRVPLGQASTSDDYFGGLDGFRRAAGDFYDMLLEGGVRRQLVVTFERSPQRLAGVGLNGFDRFPAWSGARLEALSPHLRRALDIQRRLGNAMTSSAIDAYLLLDQLDVGVILLDRQLRVRYSNGLARQRLGCQGALALQAERLVAQHSGLARPLRTLLDSALRASQRDARGTAGGSLLLPAAPPMTAVRLDVIPMSGDAGPAHLRQDGIALAVLVCNPLQPHRLSLAALRQRYQLTPREAELCQAFLNSNSLEQVALSLGLRLSTVRTMLKSVFDKTGEDSQPRLMRLLMNCCLQWPEH